VHCDALVVMSDFLWSVDYSKASYSRYLRRAKEDGPVSGLMSAGLRGRDGDPERPSCKYPASRWNGAVDLLYLFGILLTVTCLK